LSIYFADTSAFAKRYLPETGAKWVAKWIEPKAGNLTIISELATVEFISLLARRQREKSISSNDFVRLQQDFLVHAKRHYRLVLLNRTIIKQARLLVTKHPLRALDAIQLASALAAVKVVGTLTFVSADQKLLMAAQAEGFAVDDPNAHP
jgi:predicted nucleic acid-binding protein